MKKELWTGLFLLLIVMMMSIAVRSGNVTSSGVMSMAKNRLTDPQFIMKQEIPILSMSDKSKNVFSQIYEDEDTDSQVKLEIDNSYISPAVPKGKARVLIYHTHITEAYAQKDGYTYEESGSYRTREQDKSVARIGQELTNLLKNNYGIDAVHDTTDFEPPKLGTAYSRSLTMLENRIKSDGEYDIYIDIHRDAYDYTEEDTLTINGQQVAKIMLVVGTGEGNNGTPILPRPDYKANYAYAKQITDNINSKVQGLAKTVRVNKSRYNQHISKRAILVEMGYTGNNMDEVLRSVPYLAESIASTIQN